MKRAPKRHTKQTCSVRQTSVGGRWGVEASVICRTECVWEPAQNQNPNVFKYQLGAPGVHRLIFKHPTPPTKKHTPVFAVGTICPPRPTSSQHLITQRLLPLQIITMSETSKCEWTLRVELAHIAEKQKKGLGKALLEGVSPGGVSRRTAVLIPVFPLAEMKQR